MSYLGNVIEHVLKHNVQTHISFINFFLGETQCELDYLKLKVFY